MSWNFYKKWTGSWKSHGIFKFEQKVMEKSWNFANKFFVLMKRRRHAAAFQNPMTCMSIKRSWNFVIRSWKSLGKVMEFCRDDCVATLCEWDPRLKLSPILAPIHDNAYSVFGNIRTSLYCKLLNCY